ncbi:hypothetical protein D918_04197 [Trichuris suis]|nr:hypothetical protein D918_04197 [Trichuris suis]
MASVSQLEGHRDFQHGDPKPLGMFGAPACHCTSIVLALCVSLSGLMLAGTGACICGFLWHDMTPKLPDLAVKQPVEIQHWVFYIRPSVTYFWYTFLCATRANYDLEGLDTTKQPFPFQLDFASV